MNKDYFYSWFSGFVDGEGCFVIAKAIGGRKAGEPYCSAGMPSEFYPRFILGLRDDDAGVLRDIKKQLGFGSLCSRGARCYKGVIKGKPQLRFVVRRMKDCLRLIELFDKYPLMSKKRKDYQIWRSFTIAKSLKSEDYDFLKKSWEDIKEVRKYKDKESSLV